MRNKLSSVLIMLISFGSLEMFGAENDVAGRCATDQLGTMEQVLGRNAWARKCGYIKASIESANNEDGWYLVFTTGKYNGNPNIPVDQNAGCITGLTKLAFCPKGCYSPSQTLLFIDGYKTIVDAYSNKISQVTSLTSDSSISNFNFGLQKIGHYIAGDTSEVLLRIIANNGRKLEVTSEHPMVNEDGDVIRAKDIVEGQKLFTQSGELVVVVKIESFNFEGKVWNIQPKTKNKLENIFVAEGFLTGSNRFQNQWASDGYRIAMRDDIDISFLIAS